MKCKNVAFVTAVFLLMGGFNAKAVPDYRSMKLTAPDGSDIMTINMAERQIISFSADSLIVSSSRYRLVFSRADIGGWTYSSDYNPEMPSESFRVPLGDGSSDTPYNIAACLNGASGTGVWVTGYIVGSFTGSSVAENANFSDAGHVKANILLAPDPTLDDASFCVAVQLPFSSGVREDLNLVSYPENRGKEVSVKGTLSTYGQTVGVVDPTNYSWGRKGWEESAIEGLNALKPGISVESGYLEIIGQASNETVAVTDINGRIVISGLTDSAGSLILDLGRLTPGIYIVSVNGRQSVKITVSR